MDKSADCQQVAAASATSGRKHVQVASKQHTRGSSIKSSNKQQFSSLILFLSVIIIVNLSPFQSDLDISHNDEVERPTSQLDRAPTSTTGNIEQSNDLVSAISTPNNDGRPTVTHLNADGKQFNRYRAYEYYFGSTNYIENLQACLKFVELMFTNPLKLGVRRTRSIQAEAKVLGKMAKMWYIKKKIKKLSKKLKKHTIAVPVFTAIPIYEHSYYPQPHVTHVSHGGMHHAAAASSYSPAVTQAMAAAAAASHPAVANQAATQQMATSASTNHQQYSRVPSHYHHPHPQAMYNHPMYGASSQHQIINSYNPSPPLFVDDAGGLYGHYGNAYGRYDGGYQHWM